MPTIEQLEQAIIKAHRAGDQRALKLIQAQIQRGASAEDYAGEPIEGMGAGGKILGGLKHAWDKAAYGLEGAVKGAFGGKIDPEHQAQLDAGKAFVENAGNWAKTGEFAGDVVPYIGTGAATVARGLSLPLSMLAQGATGAVVTPGDAKERATAGAMGAVGEGAGQLLMKSLGRLTGGVKNITPEAQRMIDDGIYPTLGGLKGGLIKKTEDTLMSVPGLGDAIQMGRRGAINEANIAALNRGLPDGTVTDAGHAGQEQLQNYFGKVFGDATDGIRFDLSDPALQTAVADAARNNGLTKESAELLDGFFRNARYQRGIPEPTVPGASVIPGNLPPQPPTYISGKDFHSILQELRQQSAAYRKNPNSTKADIDTGNAYRTMYDEMSRLARQQGVSDAGALDAFDAARKQYAMVAPAVRAGNLNNVAGKNKGIFSPAQYENQNAANMKAMGQLGMLRTGKGPNQQFANDMSTTLGSNYPDSGTVGRLLSGGLMLGELAVSPNLLLGSLGGYALNSPAGRRYMAGALPGQKALADALRAKAQAAGATGAALMGQTQNDF